MKRRINLFVPLLLFMLLVLADKASAQQEVERLEQLVVDLWPDYDRAAVLVLLTGRVPEEISLPVQITIPLPEEADLNAVARITDDNSMIDDIVFDVAGEQLTMTVPERRFRVEYYLPYDAEGLERSFTYTWDAGIAVDDLNVSVQRPAQAAAFTTTPASEIVGEGNDGLTYHDFLVSPLGAGEPFQIEVDYTMSSSELTTAQSAAPAPAPTNPDTVPAASGEGLEIDWPLFLAGAGVLFILLALIWHFWGTRPVASAPPRKPGVRRTPPAPRRSKGSGKVRFCHECGTEAHAGDRFCRACGTELKK